MTTTLGHLHEASSSTAGPFAQLTRRLSEAIAGSGRSRFDEVSVAAVPGRVELLGKHTDYGGGSSLVLAVPRYVVAAATPGQGRILDVDKGLLASVDSGDLDLWGRYPVAALRALRGAGAVDRVDVFLTADLPRSAGMSSSTALLTATFLSGACLGSSPADLLSRVGAASIEELADLLADIESGRPTPLSRGADTGAGTRGGSQDHLSVLACRPGQILHASFRPSRIEGYQPFPDSWALAVGVTGVSAEKGGAAKDRYNQLASDMMNIEALLRGGDFELPGDLARSGMPAEQRDRFLDELPESLRERWRQFSDEVAVNIPAALDAVGRGDAAAMGAIGLESHRRAAAVLANQVPETEFLTDSAVRLGAWGASAFGAGFGGSVWALHDRNDDFLRQWSQSYQRKYPAHRESTFFDVQPTGGAAVYQGSKFVSILNLLAGVASEN